MDALNTTRADSATAPRRPGFTLIELLAVMAIMGLLMGLSVVAFKDMGRGVGMRGATIQFKSNLSLARQQAITRRTPVRIIYANTNDATGWRGLFYMADVSNNLIGAVNFLSRGIQFAPTNSTVMDRVEFKADGSCNRSVGTWDSGQPRRAIDVVETGRRAMTNRFRVYEKTGRVKVLTESLN